MKNSNTIDSSSSTILMPYDPQLAQEKINKMENNSDITVTDNVIHEHNARNENDTTFEKITLLNVTEHKEHKDNSDSTTAIDVEEQSNIVPYDSKVARAKLIELEINKVNTVKSSVVACKSNNYEEKSNEIIQQVDNIANDKFAKDGLVIETNAQEQHDVCATEKEPVSDSTTINAVQKEICALILTNDQTTQEKDVADSSQEVFDTVEDESTTTDRTDNDNDNNNDADITKVESEDSCDVELLTFDKIKMINKRAHTADYERKLTKNMYITEELRQRFYLIANENICILIHKYGVESELNNNMLKASELMPSYKEVNKPFTLPVNGERVVKLPEMIEKPLVQMYYFALSTLTQYEWRMITSILTSSTNSANVTSHLSSLRNLHVRRLQSINSVLETSSLCSARRTMLQRLNNELEVKINAYKEITDTYRKIVEPLPREYRGYIANSKRRHLCGPIKQNDAIKLTHSYESNKTSNTTHNVTANSNRTHYVHTLETLTAAAAKKQNTLEQQQQQLPKGQKNRTSIKTTNAPQTRESKPPEETLEFAMANHENSYTQKLLGKFHSNFTAEVRALFVEDCGVVCYRAWRKHVNLHQRKSSSSSSLPLEKEENNKAAALTDTLHDKPCTMQEQGNTDKGNDDKNIKSATKSRTSIIFSGHVLTKDELHEYNELLSCCQRALTKYFINIFGWNDAYAEPIAKSLAVTILRWKSPLTQS